MDNPITESNLTEKTSKKPTIKTGFDWHRFLTLSKSTNINWFKTAKYIYPLTIAIIVGVLIWFMSFLYDNVYTTMSQAAELSGLKSKVVEERLNLEEFEQILKKIKDKENLINWNNASPIITPFALGNKQVIPSTSTPATTTLPIINTSTPIEI